MKNFLGNQDLDQMLSRIGVKIMVSEMIRPAFVAEVILIPLVSICMIVPTATPYSAPSCQSALENLFPRASTMSVMIIAAAVNLKAKIEFTDACSVKSFAAR